MPFDATPYQEPNPPRDAVLDILIGARVLLSKPNGWTRQALARNAKREQCELTDPNAVAFCFWGAIRHTCSLTGSDVFSRRDAVRTLGFLDAHDLIDFNDCCHNRKPVLTRLDRGIAKRQLELQITETTDAV